MSFEKNLKDSPIVGEALKTQARETINTTSWPTTRVERWKYTRLSKLQKIDFVQNPSNISDVTEFLIDSDAITYVFVNGRFTEQLGHRQSSSEVKIYSSSSDQLKESTLPLENDLFNALNLAFLNDAIEINIPKKAIERFQIVHILDGEASISNFKTIINSADLSESNFTIAYLSTSKANNCFANVTTEVRVGKNAKVVIDKIQYENDSCFHIGSELVDQETDSAFTMNTITLNGALVRNNLSIRVKGQNAETNLNGAAILKGKQHIDNHTIVDHRVAHCNSNELYKGVVDEDGTVVFNGKVFVRPDAQKINAFQSNANILLSDNGSVNSKPELEIYADDVKCSHGSTTGQLDEKALFYLEARGISKDKAKALLVHAFIGEVLDKITNEDVRKFIDSKLEERFGWTN